MLRKEHIKQQITAYVAKLKKKSPSGIPSIPTPPKSATIVSVSSVAVRPLAETTRTAVSASGQRIRTAWSMVTERHWAEPNFDLALDIRGKGFGRNAAQPTSESVRRWPRQPPPRRWRTA